MLQKHRYLVVNKSGKICYIGSAPNLDVIVKQNYDIAYFHSSNNYNKPKAIRDKDVKLV
jgi:hypothetical protein